MNPKTNVEKMGAAQAALLAVALGLVTLALVNIGTAMSSEFKAVVHAIGKLWMPGAEGIGPYSGKETIALVVWLVSWLGLHRLLRFKEWNNNVVLVLFLTGIAVATTLVWPPIFEAIAHHG